MNSKSNRFKTNWAVVVLAVIPLLICLAILMYPARQAMQCPINEQGMVIPDRVVSGSLTYLTAARTYFVKDGNHMSLTVRCGKVSCNPFNQKFLNANLDHPARNELCGDTLTAFYVDNALVFQQIPLTQQQIDAANQSRREFFRTVCLIFSAIAVWGYFGAWPIAIVVPKRNS